MDICCDDDLSIMVGVLAHCDHGRWRVRMTTEGGIQSNDDRRVRRLGRSRNRLAEFRALAGGTTPALFGAGKDKDIGNRQGRGQ